MSYNNSNITALNGSDYAAQASTLTFAPGETTKVVKIPVLNTAGVEPTEVLALNLFSALNATIGRPLAIGTIHDNDQTSGTPLIRVQDQVVDEAAGQVRFVVTLDKPSTGNVSVSYATVNGTALAGSDYTALPTQTLTFTPGEMVKVVTVDLTNDALAEGREYFDLRLSSPVGATLLPQPTGRASIGGNDATAAALPLITVTDAVADESNTFLEFVVSLSAPSTQEVKVSYNNSQHHGPQRQRLRRAGEHADLRAGRDDQGREDPGAQHRRRRADRGAGAEPVQRVERDHRPAAGHRHDPRQRPDQRHAADPGAGPDRR